MLRSGLILTALFLVPFSLSAQTVLYACTINGKTTLESTPDKHCDTLKEYHYPTYSNEAKAPPQNGLRPLEIKQLEAMDSQDIPPNAQLRRYENVDDRVGWSLAHGYIDSRHEKCNYFQGLLDQATSYIAAKNAQDTEIGPYTTAELTAQINYAQTQADYYCGQ